MSNIETIEKKLPPHTGALRTGRGIQAIVPTTLDETFRLAKLVAASGLAPSDMRTPEQITVALMHGMEIGLKPMQAIQRIAVINGRPSLWGDAALGLVKATGLLELHFESIEGKDDLKEAVCKIQRRGETKKTFTFSIADAKRAGLWSKKGPWQDYPFRMLKMRARSFALRDVFPDILGGMYIAEELQGIQPDIKDITPPPPPPVELTAVTEIMEPEKETATPPAPSTAPTALTMVDYEALIEELMARLKDADREMQDEIWEYEIQPRIDDHTFFPPDVAKLRAQLKTQ